MIIKSNELRLGSLVDVIDRSQKVHLPFNIVKKVGYIDFFKVDLYEPDKPFAIQGENWEVDVRDLSPISLTEEVIIKLGFKYWPDNGNCFTKKYSQQGDFILFNHKTLVAEGAGLVNGDYYYMFHGLIHTIRYVHQLQNIFFAITGEELFLTHIIKAPHSTSS